MQLSECVALSCYAVITKSRVCVCMHGNSLTTLMQQTNAQSQNAERNANTYKKKRFDFFCHCSKINRIDCVMNITCEMVCVPKRAA